MTFPSGTVTFLFTDIEGSTKLAQQYPDAMPALLTRHHEILKQAVQKQNGYVFQIIGDAFCVAFSSVIEAINAAMDVQRCLFNEEWKPAPIKVRMGIHSGMAKLQEDGQYSGYATMAFTQRIMSAGHGGQILISGATRELVRDALPADTDLQDMGEKRLKDLLRPEHLYQLNISGLPSTFPPLKTLDSFPNNLPIQLTSFIGRENEIAEVKQELAQHRLVTLTGSGGTGKTRLSLQVAADLLEKFDHGVWFVELAPLTDPDLIPQTVLSTIGIQDQQGKAPLDVLAQYLQEKQTLLLLDNCEHLIEASARVANTLLNAAPRLKILASSREALGVNGEASYPVPSLSLPDIKHLPAVEGLSQYEAVRLFIDRVLLIAPHFVVDNASAPFIAQICHRLDGIPLAIELAAARIKLLSVEQICKRLDDRFRLLTGGARTSLPRQQTLRALIDWSYDLLSDHERLLLQRLSVFAGSWTLAAAEEVCVGQDDILSYDILDLLTQLVNKSLVIVIEHSQSGETRYRMLETIRQYAREKLLDSGGGESLRDKHLAYFRKFVEQAEPELYRARQVFWLNKLEDELDNLRVALDWALVSDTKSGLQIASLAHRFWDTHTQDYRELGDWLKKLLEHYEAVDSVFAHSLAVHSYCFFMQGNFKEAIRVAEQSLHVARTIADQQSEAFSLYCLGAITALQGNVGEGTRLLEQSLALYRSLGNQIGQANTLEVLAYDHRDFGRTIEWARESLAIHRELGNLIGIANALLILARSTIWSGDTTSPMAWLEETLSIARQLGSQTTKAFALHTFGILAYWQGNYENAIAYFEEMIRLGDQIGDFYQKYWAQVRMAYVFLKQGEIQRAHKLFVESIMFSRQTEFMISLVYTMEGLASLHANHGDAVRAVQLFTWADTMREKMGDRRPPVEQASVERDLEFIRSQLDDAKFETAYITGRTLTVEQAIALALEDNDD